MKPLSITGSDSGATPGDFGACVDGANSRLLLPQELSDKLAAHGIRTASELISYLQSFPTAAAKDLDWSTEDLSRGADRLKDQLRGYVDDSILHPPPRPKHGYGGLNAADLKRRG